MRRTQLTVVLLLVALMITAGIASAQPANFRAHLSGGQEVPAVDTNAQGQAIFQLDASGSSLDYKLIVANIENVFASHIHCAATGNNGPVGATLFFSPPPNLGRVNGVLAEGSITAPDAGNGCGWADLAAIVAAMESGSAYVNVHTLPGVPSGEIRGQIH